MTREPLIQDEDGEPEFFIEFKDQNFEIGCDFKVFDALNWVDNDGEREMELYIKGYIKWDGCSHIWFGEEDGEGYIHLCGKGFFDKHYQVMDAVWDVCTKKIINFNEDLAL